MLVFLGHDNRSRDKALQECAGHVNETKVFLDDNILVICKTESKRDGNIYENPFYLLIIEGHLAGNQLTSHDILSSYEEHGINFLLRMNGYFNLLLWDKRKKNAIIANDKLGLNPLYYSKPGGGSIILSTRLKELSSFLLHPRELDVIALKQFALFSYILDKRTFIADVFRLDPGTALVWDQNHLDLNSYWDLDSFFHNTRLKKDDFLHDFPELLYEVLDSWVNKKPRVGILLSGGYDSRAILACLSKMGASGYAYTWDNPYVQVKDGDIAHRLAEIVGFQHKYLQYDPPETAVSKLMDEVAVFSEYNLNLSHIGECNAAKEISSEVDILISGEAEIIRVTPVPNDYIMPATLAYLRNENLSHNSHLFNAQLLSDEISLPGPSNKAGNELPSEELTKFLVLSAYRNTFGMLRLAQSSFLPVIMPLFDARIIERLLSSPFSIAHMRTWKSNILATFNNRRIYLDTLEKYAPELLDVRIDRGYPLRWDRDIRGIFMTSCWGFRSKLGVNKKTALLSWKKCLRGLLSESKTLSRSFYDIKKIQHLLNQWPGWKSNESYELEKVGRFELWYRYFFE